MNFIPKQQTLENISLGKIAASLWNKHDIRVLVEEFAYSDCYSTLGDIVYFVPEGKWKKIEDQVKEKIANVIIPTSLKEKMLGYIQLVGVQIIRWMEYHLKYCSLDLNLPNEICWTPQATIDKKKTAEVLVKDVAIDITTRYKLACIYCLEDNLPELWNELPENEKEIFYSEEDPSKVSQTELVVFWGYYIKGEVAKIDDMIRRKGNHSCSYTYLFRYGAESGNKAATEYFLQKLNPREKIVLTLNIASSVAEEHFRFHRNITAPPKVYYSEVLCFLLSQISKEQQIEVFKTNPEKVLYFFMDWPWQSFFVEIAGHLWKFLPQSKYHFVFRIILRQLQFGYRDYNYKELFRDVWLQTPDADKSYIINNVNIVGLLEMLLLLKDEENFKLIFQDTTLIDKGKLIFREKYKLIFSFQGRCLCKIMIDCDKWDLFKYFVHLLISSKDEMIKFKKELEKFVQTDEGKLCIDKLEKLFPLLDDFVREYEKRKNVDEAGSSSAKRLCNTEFNDVAYGSKE